MQVTETLNDGLKRKLSLSIPAADLASKLDAKLEELKSQANIKGFRPGKVPMSHLKKVYGKSAMSDVMQDAINSGIQDTLTERDERAATQPKVELSEDEAVIAGVIDGKADLDFDVSYEILPTFDLMDFKSIKVAKPVVEIPEEDLDKEANRVFLSNKEYEDKGDDAVVADGDKIGLNFEGKIDGELFDGGKTDHAHLIIGSGEFIPGFEEQLIGVKKGGKKDVTVTFPADYTNDELAGKEAVFAVEVLHIDGPKDGELNDEFAKKLGLDDVAAFKAAVKDQMSASIDGMAKQRVKRQVLDALDEGQKFEVPAGLVEAEFDVIWQRVTHEIKENGKSFEDEGTTEEEARTQYNTIAERRVRLGLVIAEVGNKNKIEVTEEEHQQALIAEVRRFQGQEQQVYDYYRQNQQALASLRAPIFENKVVEFVTELATITEDKMSRADLVKAIQKDEEENVVSEE